MTKENTTVYEQSLELDLDDRKAVQYSNSDDSGPDNCVLLLCTDFIKCKDQMGTAFCSVPTSPATLYLFWNVVLHQILDIVTTHQLLKSSGPPNFLH